MEKEYESEKKEPEIKKGSFWDKLLKHLRVDYCPDEEDEGIKVKRLWKCGTPMAYQQMREEEKKKQNKKVDKKQSMEEFLAKLGWYGRREYYMDDDWVPMKNSDGDFS